MKRLTLLFTCLLFLSTVMVTAQTRRVTGVVISGEDNSPLIGAMVSVKGKNIGIAADNEGRFVLANVPSDAKILVISYLGFETKEVGIQSDLRIVLNPSSQLLEEVVVTAMGISREKKSLGYATQEVKGDVLTQAASSNIATALQGKTTGLNIRQGSGMPGASTQITIRGARSFNGNNQPLYVIDGMPVASNADISTGDGVVGTDFANRAVDIDPNDIESVNILKGQAASALYGIRASNGVIIITTKSGKGIQNDKTQVTFSSNLSMDAISRWPELQATYAQGSGGRYSPTTSMSWGPKISELPNDPGYGGNTDNRYTQSDGKKEGHYYVPQMANAGLDPWVKPQAYNNVKDYFKTGTTWNNSVNIAKSSAGSTYSLSLGNSTQTGIISGTGMDRYNAKFMTETSLDKHWKSGVSANYVNTAIKKLPTANEGITATIYPAPPSYNLAGIPQYYKDNPTKINNYRGGAFPPAYWSMDNLNFSEKTDRFFGNAFISYSGRFNDKHKLEIKYQPGIDFYTSTYQDLWGYGIKGSSSNGQVENYNISNKTFNSLLTANYDWDINEKLHLNALLGNEIIHNTYQYLYAYGANFEFPGWNHIGNATSKDNAQSETADRMIGFFGSINMSYNNMLYLTVTGRNDVKSDMPHGSRTFFYPSASLGFILTELDALKNLDILNYAKLRTSYVQVGQAGGYTDSYYSTPAYGSGFYMITPILYPIGGQNAYTPHYRIYDPNLKPQNTKSYEFGFDSNWFKNLITFNYTFSRQNINDQIFAVPLAGSTGISEMVRNAGNVHTNTHEITLGANPVRTKNINWNFAFNWTKVDNYVDELAPGVESIMLGGFVEPQVRAGIGDKYPVIYGIGYKRDDKGRILVDEDGIPMAGEPQVIGRVAPDFWLGFQTSLTVHDLTLSAVLDWKCGGQIYSGTNALLDYYGVSKRTEGREGSFIFDGYKADGTKNDIAISGANEWQTFYTITNEISESFIYDNSYVKLREIALSYPILKKSALRLDLNVFARNMLLWSELPNFDPESSQGNTNMMGAFERFSLPQTSSYGFGITVKF